MWDEEKLDGFYTDENLMKRERVNVGNWKGQKEKTIDAVIFLRGYELSCLFVARLYVFETGGGGVWCELFHGNCNNNNLFDFS